MKLGYNTNGFPYHRLEDALTILADLGYLSVAITLDYHALNPYDAELPKRIAGVKSLLGRLRMASVIETGARFLLDPLRKHQPTLLSEDPEQRKPRYDFLRRSIDVASELEADAVSFWSGTPTSDEPEDVLMARLVRECQALAEFAAEQGVRLAFEPEPGMFIDTMAKFCELHERVNRRNFGLTIDIGHLHCMGDVPISAHLRAWKDRLWNVHIEDMRRGGHEHLMFGDGEIDFPPVLQTLKEIGYSGGVHVELSRHGHDAVEVARRSQDFLRAIWP